ncbi:MULTISPECIES: hypothetical protein [unclassified Methylophilus]|uniref:hypothetical protein n=1 Tax=unclassified Methylophilus TaxID=2630143 RepID=UPI00037E2930|nr:MULTISPECIES: hypothetical protein [unclassified Methylophilus]
MNITRKIASTTLVALAIAVSGCSTMQDVVKVKQSGAEGTTKNYAVTEAQAWEIAKTVFRWEGADAIEEHRDQHYMLTSSGVNLVSWGAVMGAWVEPVKDDDTKVTVVTKRRVTVNVATTLTETTFHKRFAQAVNIVKQGKPLPAEAP